jgi:hypothetical protein
VHLDLPERICQEHYRCGQCDGAILDDEITSVCPRCHTILCVDCERSSHVIPAGDRAGVPCGAFPDDWTAIKEPFIPVLLAGLPDLDWHLEPDERAF